MPSALEEAKITLPSASSRPPRSESIDILRGLVIVVMTLDHVRDFFSSSAGLFEPTDLARTNAALFFTRWFTHFCAPIFVLLAGVGAYQAGVRGRSKSELSRFLLTRGAWLILLEILFVTPFGWSFQWNLSLVRLQVIWAIGASLLLLGTLLRFHPRVIGGLGLAIVAGHNLGDKLPPELWTAAASLWRFLHSIQFFRISPDHTVASLYPLVPWVGVVMAGYGLGEIWTWPVEQRRRWLLRTGLACLGTFLVLRLANHYGDPNTWAVQQDNLFTLLSFLNVSKYPPSLCFLTLTLGPALLALGWLEKFSPIWAHPLRVFGRVPLFFYLIHLPLIHGLAILSSWLNHGGASWLWRDPFLLRRPPIPAPPDYGFGLPVVYCIWIACIATLYPLCKWYGTYKAQKKHPFWSYL